MNSLMAFLAAGLLALAPCIPFGMVAPSLGMAGDPASSLQEPEDPSRILNLLNGLVDRVQESSPVLAAIIKFLAFLVYLVLNIKTWGPPALVVMVVIGGFVLWQGRRKDKQSPSVEEEPEAEPEM